MELQKVAFDSTFDTIVVLQDRQEQLFTRMLEQTPNLPPEARETLDGWVGALEAARAELKSSADRSFDLLERFFSRLQGDAEQPQE